MKLSADRRVLAWVGDGAIQRRHSPLSLAVATRSASSVSVRWACTLSLFDMADLQKIRRSFAVLPVTATLIRHKLCTSAIGFSGDWCKLPPRVTNPGLTCSRRVHRDRLFSHDHHRM